MNKLNKMSISNIDKHHQKTIEFYFRNVWYDEDIIKGLLLLLLWNSMLCDVVSIFL